MSPTCSIPQGVDSLIDSTHIGNSVVSTKPNHQPINSSRVPDAVQRATATKGWQAERIRKTTNLNHFFSLVEGKCPVCFVCTGALVCHIPFKDCGQTHLPSNFQRYRRAFSWKPYTYCHLCGCPQERNFNQEEPDCHVESRVWNGRQKICPWKDFVFIVLHCIWHTSQRHNMLQAFGLSQELALDGFLVWADAEDMMDGKYYNGLEVFLWYCEMWTNTHLRGG